MFCYRKFSIIEKHLKFIENLTLAKSIKFLMKFWKNDRNCYVFHGFVQKNIKFLTILIGWALQQAREPDAPGMGFGFLSLFLVTMFDKNFQRFLVIFSQISSQNDNIWPTIRVFRNRFATYKCYAFCFRCLCMRGSVKYSKVKDDLPY